MVSEIRRRASNQSTEAASRAIADFLEIENREEDSRGWMLLSTLNLLSAGTPALIGGQWEILLSEKQFRLDTEAKYYVYDEPCRTPVY